MLRLWYAGLLALTALAVCAGVTNLRHAGTLVLAAPIEVALVEGAPAEDTWATHPSEWHGSKTLTVVDIQTLDPDLESDGLTFDGFARVWSLPELDLERPLPAPMLGRTTDENPMRVWLDPGLPRGPPRCT